MRPPRPPEVPGLEIAVVFEAAGEGVELGGDLYDVLPTEDGCWAVVGDVAGKGPEAAGVSVAVRHTVRGLTREIEEPREVLQRVNELLLEGTDLTDFATALLLRLRRGAGRWRASIAGAGHPPAVHLSKTGPVQLGGGSMLGVRPDPPLAVHELALEPGDTLILLTDGWLEAGPLSHHRQPEDLASMAAELSGCEVGELADRLRRDAVARSDGPMRDDMVVLVLRPAVDVKAGRGGLP